MMLLGLLLMAACAALAVDAVIQNTHLMHAVAFNQSVTHLSLGALFVAGAVVGLLFALGLLMFTGGIGRAARRRRERRVATREARAENRALREHNERLAAELEQERTATPYPSDGDTATVTDADAERTTDAVGGRHRA